MLTPLLFGVFFGLSMFFVGEKTHLSKDIKWFFTIGAVMAGLFFGFFISLTVGSFFRTNDVEVLKSQRIDKREICLFVNDNSGVVLGGEQNVFLFGRDNLVDSGRVVFSNDEFITLLPEPPNPNTN